MKDHSSDFLRSKMYLRNTTGEQWLNGLVLLNIYPETEINADEVLNKLAKKNKKPLLWALKIIRIFPLFYDINSVTGQTELLLDYLLFKVIFWQIFVVILWFMDCGAFSINLLC